MSAQDKLFIDMIALRKSIEHWERMRDDPAGCVKRGEGPFAKDCALCEMYLRHRCEGCPLSQRFPSCGDTPYFRAHQRWTHSRPGGWPPAAQAMIDHMERRLLDLKEESVCLK